MSVASLLKKNKGEGFMDYVSGMVASAKDLPKVELVPISVPLQRRLQTLACYFYFSMWLESHLLLAFLATKATLWPFLLLYFTFIYFDFQYEKGGRWSDWYRGHIVWTWLADYFPAKIIKECDLDSSKKHMFVCHPHGIFAAGALLAFGCEGLNISKLFPGIRTRILTLNANFYFPIYRELLLYLGACGPSKESINSIFEQGDSVAVVVGGAQESLLALPHTADLILANRKGFVAMAIKNGASLVPVYSFGENELFDQIVPEPDSPVSKFQKILKKFTGFTLPVYYGRCAFAYNYGLMPRRSPLNIVIGPPVDTVRTAKPSAEQVDQIHTQYMDALKDLYERNKEKYSVGGVIPELRFH
ncbi:diacylglycerol O-acyltransferase 1 [Entomophthora muscae]|uniref:Diacylglycerol O-acyltransferase 1 n=1 Tax=Entomophthora muscae TaxID=34485 RepID=A0ACC2RHE4_9FUNG|nr:diacylglycerol O-acyltransferase 1 [Entomophthora muscae]